MIYYKSLRENRNHIETFINKMTSSISSKAHKKSRNRQTDLCVSDQMFSCHNREKKER